MKRLLILCLLFPVISHSQTIIKGYDYCKDTLMEHLDAQRIKKKIRKRNKNVDFFEKRDFLTSYDKQGNYIVEDYANNNPDFFVVFKYLGGKDSIIYIKKEFNKEGNLISKAFYIGNCIVDATYFYNEKGALIQKEYVGEGYYIGVNQLQAIISSFLELDIFNCYDDSMGMRYEISRQQEEGKLVYQFTCVIFESGIARSYYIDAYDGKILYKDEKGTKECSNSLEYFPKEKIAIPLRKYLSCAELFHI